MLLPLLVWGAMAQPDGPSSVRPVRFQPRGEEKINLAGVLHLPQSIDDAPLPALIMCHPDPRMRGTMDDRVVSAVASAAVSEGIAVLRFNFRGVGGSAGEFAGGVGEVRDVLGAADLLRAQAGIDSERIVLGGYSFGSAVALRAMAQDEAALAYVGVALPYSAEPDRGEEMSFARGLKKPLFVVIGDRDAFGDAEAIRGLLPADHARVMVLPGADHFFFDPDDALANAAEAVSEFVKEQVTKEEER